MALSVRARAALLLFTAILPVAGGLGRALDALRGPQPHFCVCPLDAEGDCQCPECIRLGIHERHRDQGEHDDHDHENGSGEDALRVDPGPMIASSCTPAPDDDNPVPASLERAILPRIEPILAPLPVARLELVLPPALHARASEPSVPPPRPV